MFQGFYISDFQWSSHFQDFFSWGLFYDPYTIKKSDTITFIKAIYNIISVYNKILLKTKQMVVITLFQPLNVYWNLIDLVLAVDLIVKESAETSTKTRLFA